MKKTALLLALAACLPLLSCNPKEKAASTGAAGGTSSGSQAQSGDAGSAEPIKIGFNFEETGEAASFGQSSRKGAEMAVEEINAAGGILGRQIAPVFDDNACDPGQAAQVATKLIDQDKVALLIGSVMSSNSLAMGKIAEEKGVPMVTPASTKPSVTVNEDGSVKKFVFRTCFTDDFQGEGMVSFCVSDKLNAKTAVVFYDADNDYSIGIYETIKRVAAGKGLTIVSEDSYLGKSETDFRSRLNKFKTQKFDVLIVPGYYDKVALIANQAREVGITAPLIGGDGWDSPDLWKVAGKNIEGCFFTNHYSSEDQDPAVQDYIARYKENYGGNIPDAMSILAYDAVKVVADALTRAGGTEPDAVVAALAGVSGFKAASGTITINEHHDASKKLVVLEVVEGGGYKWVYSVEPGGAEGEHTDAANPCDAAV